MKPLALFLLFLSPFSLVAQTKDSISLALVAVDPDSSAIGSPIGEKTTKTIGPEGGKIVSADGMMELTFPPGAVAAPTQIGIQHVENTVVSGFGNAYDCTPDGTRFQKPVDVLIHYTNSAAKGISPKIQTIRWQDKTGRWTSLDHVITDTSAHTIHGKIEHFCTIVGGTTFTLLYPYPPLNVSQQRVFKLEITGKYPDGKKYTKDEAEVFFWTSHQVVWTVNDQEGGDDIYGKIHSAGTADHNFGIYVAPAIVPGSNPVIGAKYVDRVPVGDGYTEGAVATRTVVIYDEFHYSFTGYDQIGHLFMVDSSMCDVRVESTGAVKMKNIQNPLPLCDWPPKEGKCSYEYPDKTGWKGMVQISGTAAGAYAAPKDAKQNGEVTIFLPTTMGSSPKYIQHCPGSGTRTIASMPVPAQPTSISIEMRPDGSVWVYNGNARGKGYINEVKNSQGFEVRVARKSDPDSQAN